MSYEQQDEMHELAQKVALIRDLHELGAVELTKPKRRFGFEKRLERADNRARVAPAWGPCPQPREDW